MGNHPPSCLSTETDVERLRVAIWSQTDYLNVGSCILCRRQIYFQAKHAYDPTTVFKPLPCPGRECHGAYLIACSTCTLTQCPNTSLIDQVDAKVTPANVTPDLVKRAKVSRCKSYRSHYGPRGPTGPAGSSF